MCDIVIKSNFDIYTEKLNYVCTIINSKLCMYVCETDMNLLRIIKYLKFASFDDLELYWIEEEKIKHLIIIFCKIILLKVEY